LLLGTGHSFARQPVTPPVQTAPFKSIAYNVGGSSSCGWPVPMPPLSAPTRAAPTTFHQYMCDSNAAHRLGAAGLGAATPHEAPLGGAKPPMGRRLPLLPRRAPTASAQMGVAGTGGGASVCDTSREPSSWLGDRASGPGRVALPAMSPALFGTGAHHAPAPIGTVQVSGRAGRLPSDSGAGTAGAAGGNGGHANGSRAARGRTYGTAAQLAGQRMLYNDDDDEDWQPPGAAAGQPGLNGRPGMRDRGQRQPRHSKQRSVPEEPVRAVLMWAVWYVCGSFLTLACLIASEIR
jgi:hypothetical protein